MKGKDAAKPPPSEAPVKVMTLPEVAAYLHVHPATIYRLARSHQIPAFRIGTDWRFHVEALDRWRLQRAVPHRAQE